MGLVSRPRFIALIQKNKAFNLDAPKVKFTGSDLSQINAYVFRIITI